MSVAIAAFGFSSDEDILVDKIKVGLVREGFENVAVVCKGDSIIVTYENRLYRHEIKAIRKVTAMVSSVVKEETNITLVPQNRRIPLAAVFMSAGSDFRPDVYALLDTDSIWEEIKGIQKVNSSFYKFDIVIHPQFKALFGEFIDPIQSQVNVAPELRTTIWRGTSLSAQLIIPLQSDPGFGEEGDSWRPGLLTLNQAFRLPHDFFISGTIGYFTRNRYGTDLEVRKYFLNGRCSIGANVGYTGYAIYLRGGWYYSSIDLLTAFLDAEYRFPSFDLSLRATYGEFLYRDKGWRVDVLRQFGEVDIGFFALSTTEGSNGGFRFSIPLFPPKYLRTRRFRISPAKEFSWEYRYKGYKTIGYRYETGHSIDSFVKKLNSDYIEKQINEN
jgi:hypothetical protein